MGEILVRYWLPILGEIALLVLYVMARREGTWKGFVTAWWLVGAACIVLAATPGLDRAVWFWVNVVGGVSAAGLLAMALGRAGYKG